MKKYKSLSLAAVGAGFGLLGVAMQAGATAKTPKIKVHKIGSDGKSRKRNMEHRGRVFFGISGVKGLTRTPGESGATVLTSAEMPTELPANEIIVSWNADTPKETGIKVEARTFAGEHATKWYVMGLWSKDGAAYPRESVKGQKDDDGDVQTDTLVLKKPADRVQVRVTLLPPPLPPTRPGEVSELLPMPMPTLKYIAVSVSDTHTRLEPLAPNEAAWGREVTVPSRTQLGWPGGSGWCSPTSTDMTLAFWSRKLNRPELDLPVPDAAHAIYDKVYDGTGNWPFNTAFAGSFRGMRAYVTRFSDIRELEEWTLAGLPVVVSVSYDLLKGKEKDNDPGHLMVCDGFDRNGDIILNDPAHHPERGQIARSVWSRANFQKAWARSRGTVYLIYPEGTKLPDDTFGHWDSAMSSHP